MRTAPLLALFLGAGCYTVEYDLSSVFFIATANVLHTVPQALQDRLEVLRIPGYTEAEKLQIARRHLIPKQIAANGLSPEDIAFSDDGVSFDRASLLRGEATSMQHTGEHKLDGWQVVSRDDVIATLDALRQLVLSPGDSE